MPLPHSDNGFKERPVATRRALRYTGPMDSIPRHTDPIPDEEFVQRHNAADGKPAGIRFLAFNTVVDIEAFGDAPALDAAFDEVMELCRTYERLFSRTLPHSDISRLNEARGQAAEIDPRTFDLLTQAIGYCRESEGAFDITVGPLVRLWDFHNGVVADPAALAQAAAHVDWRGLHLWEEFGKDGSIRCFARLDDPESSVDVGGIAKGWIADALAEALKARGLDGFIINLGGNVVVRGSKPDGSPWKIGIRSPQDPSKLLGAVPLATGSAVTSGIYERTFTDQDGRTYHHILDPRTGMPADTDVAGVTLLADRSIDAEGYSTTLLALGTERGRALVRRHPEISQAFFVGHDGAITPAYS